MPATQIASFGSSATSLIASMATDFHPERYTDDYRLALQAVIEAKVEGKVYFTVTVVVEITVKGAGARAG